MQGPHLMLVASVLALAGLAGAWFGGRPPAPVPVEPEVSLARPEAPMTVHVAGAVASPGLVRLPPGARVGEAVAAAGGALSSADLQAINLAAPLRDGDQVVVPRRGAPPSGDSQGKIRLNSANAAELEQLPGVGPVLAARIVAHREQHGPFRAVEDLLDVPGVGEAKLAALRDLVEVP